jgi:hypothetical protein
MIIAKIKRIWKTESCSIQELHTSLENSFVKLQECVLECSKYMDFVGAIHPLKVVGEQHIWLFSTRVFQGFWKNAIKIQSQWQATKIMFL